MNEIKTGYVPNEVYKVEQFGNTWKLIDSRWVTKLVPSVNNSYEERTFKEGKDVQALSL